MTTEHRTVIIVGLLICFIYAVAWVRRNVCPIHWTVKDLKPYQSKSKRLYCEQCRAESTNPKMKCSCGWKGRLSECSWEVVSTDVENCFEEFVAHYCPDCKKGIIEYDRGK